MTKTEGNFYKTHEDFVTLFTTLKKCPSESIEGICNKIIDTAKGEKDHELLVGYAKKRLYLGLVGKTTSTRRSYAICLIRLLRAFPELQDSAYPDMIMYTKADGGVQRWSMGPYNIGRIVGYNILIRLGLIPKVKEEILIKITKELIILSKNAGYVEDISLKTICQIYDVTKDAAIADLILKSFPGNSTTWTPFHIGAACHIMWSDHKTYEKKLKKRFSDPSVFIETLFIRQCESQGDTSLFAWQALARYAMLDESLPWENFWGDMRFLVSRPLQKLDFTYHVFTAIIGSLQGNSHLIEDVIGGEFCRQFVFWVQNKLNLYNLRRTFLRLVELDDAKILFQLAAALLGVKDFDKRIGAPILQTILSKPESKSFDFGVMIEKLVKRYTEIRKPFVEATEEEEEEIDEVAIEARCKIIKEKLQRMCVTRAFNDTANPDWWVVGARFFLQKSCFHSEAKKDKLSVSNHSILSNRSLSIVTAHINLHLSSLKDDEWKIDRIFELVDAEALYKQFGPNLMNNADPTSDFKLAEVFLKKIPTMELTVVQRRLCEVIGKTCRLLLITELYDSCSKAFHTLLLEDLNLQDKMFKVALALIENKSRLLYSLAMLIWNIFAKTATNKQIEELLEFLSPNEHVDNEEDTDADEQEDAENSMGDDDSKNDKLVINQEKKKGEGDIGEKSLDGEKPTMEKEVDKGDKSSKDEETELGENRAEAESSSSSDSDGEVMENEDKKAAKEEAAQLKKVVMAILENKKAKSRKKFIQMTMIPKVMKLLEIFCETHVGDSLILTVICPLLERYNMDSERFGLARKIIVAMVKTKKKNLPLEGVDMATMQMMISDVLHVMLVSNTKAILDFVHTYPVFWLFKLYFMLAEKEGKLAEAEKWVMDQYNDFWSGLLSGKKLYRFISLTVFRDAMMRFPILMNSMLKYVFQTVKEGKITKPFNQYQTLCFISQAAVWGDKEIIISFKAWHLDYAETFCKLLPSLLKKIHKKTVILNFIKFVKTISSEETKALLKGSDLEKTLSEKKDERSARLMALLKV